MYFLLPGSGFSAMIFPYFINCFSETRTRNPFWHSALIQTILSTESIVNRVNILNIKIVGVGEHPESQILNSQRFGEFPACWTNSFT